MVPGNREQRLVAGLAIVGLLTLLYSVLIARQLVAWFGIAVLLALVYLAWRFLRAVERIADALEQSGESD